MWFWLEVWLWGQVPETLPENDTNTDGVLCGASRACHWVRLLLFIVVQFDFSLAEFSFLSLA